ncbi:hypothetical protein BDZ89DRAFT_1038109 [Hymenopellis radicata]|nr:hypothetical protein BDZ89DRAFT_1038109 [Hymenopellis radicata]
MPGLKPLSQRPILSANTDAFGKRMTLTCRDPTVSAAHDHLVISHLGSSYKCLGLRVGLPSRRNESLSKGRRRGGWHFFDGALKTYFIGADGKGNFTSRQIFTANNPHTGAGRKSTATPPYHWHIHQTETFDVKSGDDLDGTLGKLTAGETVTIAPGRYHTFWSDPDSGVDLDVHISGLAPNLFQMLAFMDYADVVLVDFPLWTGRLANLVIGRWIGRGIGGYDVEYKVFDEKKD